MHKQQIIIWGIIFGTMVLVVLLIFFFLLFVQFIKRKTLHIKEVEELKFKYQQTIFKTQIEIQEQTFKKIGLELHDNVGQMLVVSSLNLNSLQTNDTEMKDTANSYLTKAIHEIRNISHNLSIARINETDIYTFIENEANAINTSKKAKVIFNCKNIDAELDKDVKLVVFRIIQEVLNNCLKHANATVITILLDIGFTNFNLQINDNGKGFDTKRAVLGNGLINIKQRTEILQGKCQINSTENLGTQVHITIPIKH